MTRRLVPIALAGLLILGCAFGLAQARVPGFGTVGLCLLTGIGASLLASYLWRSRPREQWRYVSLGGVFCVYYAISYGYGVFGTPPIFTDRVLPIGLDQVNLAALPLGLIAWFLGYKIIHLQGASGGFSRLILPDTTLGPVGPATLVAAYLVTIVVRLFLIATGAGYGYLQNASESVTRVSPLSQYAAELGGFGVVVLSVAVVASAHAGDNRKGYRTAYRIMLVPELILGALVGQKSEFLLVVLSVALALVATRQVRARNLVVIGVVSLLFIFPLVDSYRSILRPDNGPQLPASEAPAALLAALGQTGQAFADGPITYARYAFDRTGGRLRELDRAAISINAHDHGRPYSSWTEMPTRIATGLVPRVLWPSKPLDLYALEVTRGYYNLPNSVISAASLSPVGDAYRYGGIFVVAIVMFLWGGYVRFLDNAFDPKNSIWLLPLLTAAIPLLRSGDLAGMLVGVIRYFLIVGILYRFVFLRVPRAPSRRSISKVPATRSTTTGPPA